MTTVMTTNDDGTTTTTTDAPKCARKPRAPKGDAAQPETLPAPPDTSDDVPAPAPAEAPETPAEAAMREADEAHGTPPVKPAEKPVAKTALNAPRGRSTFLMYPEDLHVVGVDDDVRDPADPFFDERAVRVAQGIAPFFDPLMVDDIDRNGVVSPVKVTKDGDCVKVNAGRRRTLHARKANELRVKRGDPRLRVEVMLEKGDVRDLFLSSRRENVFRVQDDPSLEAANMQRALKFGASEDEVASTFGTTVKTVRERLKLLELSIDVRQAIAVGDISPTAALVGMRDVPRAQQGAKLKELLASGNATVAALTAESKRKKREASGKGDDKPADKGDDDKKSGIKPPGKRALSKLFLALEEKIVTVPGDHDGKLAAAHNDGFKAALRYVLGDCGPRSVTGLSKALRDAGVKA